MSPGGDPDPVKHRWRREATCCTCHKRLWHQVDNEDEDEARRGGISFPSHQEDAMYVRMLGDASTLKPKAGLLVNQRKESESSPAPSNLTSALTKLLSQSEKDLLEKSEHCSFRSRLSLHLSSFHNVRKRKRALFRMVFDHGFMLDQQYNGQAFCLLAKIHDWDFNVFNLDKLSNGRSCFHVGLHLFHEHDLINTFNLDIVKLMRCISLIEEGYHNSNPYHNNVHAADVAQAMHCYLMEPKVINSLSPIEKLAAILAALTHDIDHPGVNQAFLIATSNHLAAMYQNTSVLENHHWRTAMAILHESGLFAHFSAAQWHTLDRLLKALILATDITRQQEFLLCFRKELDATGLNLSSEKNRVFMLQIALKCADISNPCRPWDISRRWSELVCDEFFKQGDYERRLNLPVTPFCDRQATTVARIQSGFMQFVVTPLFREWYRFSPTALSQFMLDNIQKNRTQWDEVTRRAELQKTKEEQEKNMIPEEDSEGSVENLVTPLLPQSRPSTPTPTLPTDTTPTPEGCPSITIEDVDGNMMTSVRTEIEDDVSDDGAEVTRDEDLFVPPLQPRRHSLPVTPVTNVGAPVHMACRGVYLAPTSTRGAPRRHSLPTPRLFPPMAFSLLDGDPLATLAEHVPSNGMLHFLFESWGPMVSSASLNASALKSASLEQSKLTSAHGLELPADLHRRLYASEPVVTLKTATPCPSVDTMNCNNNNRLLAFHSMSLLTMAHSRLMTSQVSTDGPLGNMSKSQPIVTLQHDKVSATNCMMFQQHTEEQM